MSIAVRRHGSPSLPRNATGVHAAPSPARARWREGDVVVALLVLWVASAARVIGAAVRHEIFGAEATLALVSLVLVPRVIFRARPAARPRPVARPPLRLVGKTPPIAAPGRPAAPAPLASRRGLR